MIWVLEVSGCCLFYIKYIAHYSPRSDTSHDWGIVGLYESKKLCVLIFIVLVDGHNLVNNVGDFKETEDPKSVVYTSYSLFGFVGDLYHNFDLL